MTCSSSYIKNPYLVAKIVKVLFIIGLTEDKRIDVLCSRVMSHELSHTHLPGALMKFYTDVETTGSTSEFYDKFTIRYHISLIIKGERRGRNLCCRLIVVRQVCGTTRRCTKTL